VTGSTAPDPEPSLPVWPRRPQRLATPVITDLVDRIVSGKFAAGSALPIEPVLCETFGVSRTVIREAVKSLEAMRLVRVRQGSGTTIRSLDEWDLLDPAVLAAVVDHDEELAILDDVIDLRRALEGEMAAKAAGRLTPADRDRLTVLMNRLDEETGNPDTYLDLDVEFHDVIIDASGNRLGRAVIHTVNAEAFGSVRYIGTPTTRDREQSNIGHHKIYEALLAGDGDAASAAMREHILQSWLRRRPGSGGREPQGRQSASSASVRDGRLPRPLRGW
jgi:GntR family galactonate operon transcriptional repressor